MVSLDRKWYLQILHSEILFEIHLIIKGKNKRKPKRSALMALAYKGGGGNVHFVHRFLVHFGKITGQGTSGQNLY